ncbi:mRNA 3-end processing factor [Caenispirillum salinarum AK4]|uniref:mRNA 3-end processing factor n=1 Tax=Caenispirillum salinarum AK4 TaxID=1238182 RepID=K9GSV3_9PROT|nr:ligase-associated DNA damage response exonuclease [Caenispirillum salinarum]EKV28227.1 mRNA 3-end processing factor [Caenispirillum salinarum AK4]
MHPRDWITVTRQGIYIEPGDFHIDPLRPVPRAVVTHGHADHARPGHGATLATPETLAIMAARNGGSLDGADALPYGETRRIGDVSVRLVPAGHVLGAAQIVMEYGGARVVVSGDYKRRPDPTCAGFEVVPCDVFVTEATFALPVFRHPDDGHEIAKLLDSLRLFPDRAHLVGAYALGKAQRVIALLRKAGYDRPIWLHGALQNLVDLYQAHGVDLGETRPATGAAKADMKGEIVMAPPAALQDRWSRRLPDPVTAVASGWMRVRGRARQKGVELPLILSDHADWDELTTTIQEVQAGEIWVTHGREDALVHFAKTKGLHAEALYIEGYEEDPADATGGGG